MESKILKLVVAVIGMAAFGAFGDIVPTTLRDMYDTNTLYTATQVDQKIAEATGDGASTNYVNDATNEVYKSAVKYTDAAVSDKATTNDTTLTQRDYAGRWICIPEEYNGEPLHIVLVEDGEGSGWIPYAGNISVGSRMADADGEVLTWNQWDGMDGGPLTALRTNLRGYVLGSQSNKVLAAEADLDKFLPLTGGSLSASLSVTGSTSVVSSNGKTITQFTSTGVNRRIFSQSQYTLDWPTEGGRLALESQVNGKVSTNDFIKATNDVYVVLSDKASKSDATLTEAESSPALATYTLPDTALPITYNGMPPPGWDADAVSLTYDAEDEIVILDVGSYLAGGFDPITGVFKEGNSNLRFGGNAPVRGEFPVIDIVPGTGYVLGSQTNRVLASEAEAEALRNGKLDKSGDTMTGPLTIEEPGQMGVPFNLRQNQRVFGISSPNLFGDRWIITYGKSDEPSSGVFLPELPSSSFSRVLALTAGEGHEGNLAALDASGNPTDSGLSKTNVVTFAYDVNSNRTAVTVGVPRQNDPNSEVDIPIVDEATGEFITVPEVVGPHSLAITGGADSDPYERTVASGEGAIAANKGVATNRFSVALGYHTFAAGEAAVSHGYETSALGSHSHSEGHDSQARGTFSHAEGESTFVSGYAAHAEGFYNEANGNYSHAEGFDSQTTAEAWYAHSDGIGVRATNHTAYVWQGATNSSNGPNPQPTVRGLYYSHGLGTYNINPNGGLAGFWVGESNLVQHINAALAAELTNKLDYKVSGERCTASGTWCVNDGIMGTDIIFSTGAFSESTTPNNNINNGSYITFNPSYFGMSNYETIQEFTVRARSNSGGAWPGNFVGYARLLNAADLNTVLAVSEQFTVSNFNQTVEIGLKPHVLLDTNNTYMIQFVTSLDSQTLAENIPLRLVVGSTSPLCYVNGNTSWKPIMTVNHFMSISGQMQAIVAALQSGNFNTIQGIADTMTAMSASVGVSASQQSPNRFASSSSSTGSGSTTLRVGTNADLQGN